MSEDPTSLNKHCRVVAEMQAQAAIDRRTGFVAGQYRAIFVASKNAWGVARLSDEGQPVSGVLGPFEQHEAEREASRLNARSTALALNADLHA